GDDRRAPRLVGVGRTDTRRSGRGVARECGVLRVVDLTHLIGQQDRYGVADLVDQVTPRVVEQVTALDVEQGAVIDRVLQQAQQKRVQSHAQSSLIIARTSSTWARSVASSGASTL